MNKMNEERNRGFTPEDAWNKIFTTLGKNKKMINEQLVKIQKDFPELSDTFEYLMGYIGFLRNRIHMRERRFNFGDIPPPLPPDLPSGAELICDFFGEDSSKCRCAQGDPSACGSWRGEGGGGIPVDLSELLSCRELKKDLSDTLAYVCEIYQENKDNPDYCQTEFNNIRRFVKTISDIQTQLIEIGCYQYETLKELYPRVYSEIGPL